MLKPVRVLLATLLLAGCAAQPERREPLRQALLGLGDRAAQQVLEVAVLQPAGEQVLLLARPEVDTALSLGTERVHESLTRALLAASPGPQVLDWQPAMAGKAGDNQWRLESRLEATAPRLQLSDRELLPYRLTLMLSRPEDNQVLWQTHIDGAFDATAL